MLASTRTTTARRAPLSAQPPARRRGPAEPKPESGTSHLKTFGQIATTRTCPASKLPLPR
eukprot:3388219-Pleurochrysis_carterae.AAC.1